MPSASAAGEARGGKKARQPSSVEPGTSKVRHSSPAYHAEQPLKHAIGDQGVETISVYLSGLHLLASVQDMQSHVLLAHSSHALQQPVAAAAGARICRQRAPAQRWPKRPETSAGWCGMQATEGNEPAAASVAGEARSAREGRHEETVKEKSTQVGWGTVVGQRRGSRCSRGIRGRRAKGSSIASVSQQLRFGMRGCHGCLHSRVAALQVLGWGHQFSVPGAIPSAFVPFLCLQEEGGQQGSGEPKAGEGSTARSAGSEEEVGSKRMSDPGCPGCQVFNSCKPTVPSLLIVLDPRKHMLVQLECMLPGRESTQLLLPGEHGVPLCRECHCAWLHGTCILLLETQTGA